MDDRLFWQALSFAAEAHRLQHRKGADRSPYINHCIEVARLVRSDGQTADPEVLAAALLHDVVEDTDHSLEEIEISFGKRVGALVNEMTDNTNLSGSDRKREQILKAPHLSVEGRLLKLADKTSNVRALATVPPLHWSADRQQAYLDWACEVVKQIPPTGTTLEQRFDEARDLAQEAIDRRRKNPST